MEDQAGNATALSLELATIETEYEIFDRICALLSVKCNKSVEQAIISCLDEFLILFIAGICGLNDEFNVFR